MWVVFEKAFYDARYTILWVSVGLALFGLLVVALYPITLEDIEQLAASLESLPESLVSLMGGSLNLADPVVWTNSQFFLWAVLVLGAVVMAQAFNAVTNPERNGTMDTMLAFPLSRRQVLVGRYLNTIVTLLIVLTVVFLTLLACTRIWQEFDIPVGDLAALVYGSLIILIPYATFTYALTTFIPSSKHWAGAIAYAIFFGMYFFHGVVGTSADLRQFQPLFLFDYYNGTRIVQEGVDINNILIMAAVTIVFAVLAWWRIEEKELGV